MSNSVACVFDNIGSKCKMMSRFKISAFAGMTCPVAIRVVMYRDY